MRGLPPAKVPATEASSRTGRATDRPDTAASPGEVARYVMPRLLGGGAVIYLFLVGCGLLLTRVFNHGWLASDDRSVSRWFFTHRTPTLNSWTHVGSSLSNTVSAIVLTILLVAGLRLWLHRWRESIAIFLAIQGELFIFLLVSSTVHRQRPAVKHLDPAPPTSSFPSGHTGAAVALYVGFAVILLVLSRNASSRNASSRNASSRNASSRIGASRIGALAVAGVVCLVPVAVALSRLYRGMHFLTDVVAGAVAGGLWTAIVMATVLTAPSLRRQRSG
jgi:undecaprenyl-diphosphatase